MQTALAYLLERAGSWVSGEEIAQALGISRSAVHKQVMSLRDRGIRIDAAPRKGYLLIDDDILEPEAISLNTSRLGRSIVFFQELRSTNEMAMTMAASAVEGTVVIAYVQTAGRGRLARSWASPSGGIWLSIILKPDMHPAFAPRLTMAASVAVAESLNSIYGIEAKIKWPNDILVGEKKICGILTEMQAETDRIDFAVVGIGINANVDPSAFPENWNATSISKEVGRRIRRSEFVGKILLEFEQAYGMIGRDIESVYRRWCDLSSTLGRRVRVTSGADTTGQVVGLDRDGSLMLKTDGGDIIRILAGDCIHLRINDIESL